jgi:hypothetical protein
MLENQNSLKNFNIFIFFSDFLIGWKINICYKTNIKKWINLLVYKPKNSTCFQTYQRKIKDWFFLSILIIDFLYHRFDLWNFLSVEMINLIIIK